jgi:hypothetical protein
MQRIYSLAYLTSAPMAPPDALVLAQKRLPSSLDRSFGQSNRFSRA